MRIWRLGSLVALTLLLATAAVSEAAKSQIVYRIYHFENNQWVRYRVWDAFPTGGNQPGTNTWKYEYVVSNLTFTGTGINTWYPFFNSDNLPCASTLTSDNVAVAPANWTVLQQGPVAPNYNWKERFRTTNTLYFITVGNSLSGFSLQFKWTCNYLPGTQNYDVVTSGGSESGVTMEDPDPPIVATEATTWSGVKAIYR